EERTTAAQCSSIGGALSALKSPSMVEKGLKSLIQRKETSGACVPRETVDERGERANHDERGRHRHKEDRTIAEDECAGDGSGDADNRADGKRDQPADLATRVGRADSEEAGHGGEDERREGE